MKRFFLVLAIILASGPLLKSQQFVCPAGPCTPLVSAIKQVGDDACNYTVSYGVFVCNGSYRLQIYNIWGCIQVNYMDTYREAVREMVAQFCKTYDLPTPFSLTIASKPCWTLNTQTNYLEPCNLLDPCCENTLIISTDMTGKYIVVSNSMPVTTPPPCFPSTCSQVCQSLILTTNQPLSESACSEECFWALEGNGNVKATDFMGSRNYADVVFKSNNYERMRIRKGAKNESGTQINIGQKKPLGPHDNYMLSVNGKLVAKEIVVTPGTAANWGWPDYVFENGYKLQSLEEVDAFIRQNKHLEEVPDAPTVAKDGIELTELNRILLKKIEELTLHLIRMNEKDKTLENEIKVLREALKIGKEE